MPLSSPPDGARPKENAQLDKNPVKKKRRRKREGGGAAMLHASWAKFPTFLNFPNINAHHPALHNDK